METVIVTGEDHSMQGKVQHYMFVSSAGAYNANSVEPMHVEGDPRKSSAGEILTMEACIALCCRRSPFAICHEAIHHPQ